MNLSLIHAGAPSAVSLIKRTMSFEMHSTQTANVILFQACSRNAHLLLLWIQSLYECLSLISRASLSSFCHIP